MAKVNATEFAEKWGRRLKGSTEDIRRGVERVTEAPGVKAAAKQEKMQSKLNESINDGTWAKNVAAVSVGDWKDKMIKKGVGRISSGVDGAADKMKEFGSQLLAATDASKAETDRMPDVTIEDSRARMNKHFDNMAKFKFKK